MIAARLRKQHRPVAGVPTGGHHPGPVSQFKAHKDGFQELPAGAVVLFDGFKDGGLRKTVKRGQVKNAAIF